MQLLRNNVLINSINEYFQKSASEYALIKLAQITETITENPEIMEKADNLIINEPELANQFSSFIDQYIDVIDALKMNVENVSKETDTDELLNIFVTKGDRILKNPYLNISKDLGWAEEFSPIELTDLVLAAKDDIQKKIELAYGEGTTLSDAAASAIAKEFQNSVADKGDKNTYISGDTVKYRYEANKELANRMRIARLTGPGSPDWGMVLKQREYRKARYYELKENPEYVEQYRKITLDAVNKHREYDIRIEILESKLNRTRDKEEIANIKAQIEKIKNSKLKYEKSQEAGKAKRMALRQGDSITAKVLKFRDLRNAVKKEASDKIKAKFLANEHILFAKESAELASAIQSGSASLIDLARRKLKNAVLKKADEDELVAKTLETFVPYNQWMDKLLLADKNKWFDSEVNIDSIKDALNDLADEGDMLAALPITGLGLPNSKTAGYIKAMVLLIRERLK